MSFARDRERRSNAGNRMRALLDQEAEVEDLFEQESLSDDEDFVTKPDEELHDIIDSDFNTESSDEEEEQEREAQQEDKAIAKQEREARKARMQSVLRQPAKRKAKDTKSASASQQKRPREKRVVKDVQRQSSRATTVRNRLHVEEQIKQYESKKAQVVKRDRPVVKQMTQEELLAEAAITEQENKASLEQWLEKEAEKKAKAKKKDKKRIVGPYVRYTSFTDGDERPKHRQLFMIEPSLNDPQSNIHNEITDPTIVAWHKKRDIESSEMAGRNLITFVHHENNDKADHSLTGLTDRELDRADLIPELVSWADRPPRPLKPTLCPITGLPAKYMDPKTNVPYANADAFKKIRACLNHKTIWSSNMKVYVGEPATNDNLPENWKSFMAGKCDPPPPISSAPNQ